MRPGDLLHRYLLLERLKPGGAAAPESRTFFALDCATGEPVVLQAAPAEGATARRFLEGYKVSRDSNIPALPPILSGGIHDGRAFVSSAWIPGISLKDVRQIASMDEDLANDLSWSFIRGLSHLHGQRLHHGDLKPDNLRVDPSGRVFLAGYFPPPLGAADAALADEVEAARYAPPEAYRGEPPSAAGDIYSAALILFEFFSGRRLIRRTGRAEAPLDLELLGASVESILGKNRDLPASLVPVLAQMIQLEPEARPRSATEVLELLANHRPFTNEDRLRKGLRALLARVIPRVSQRIFDEAKAAAETGELYETLGKLWRFSALVPRSDISRTRRGYQLASQAFWQALIRLGAATGAEPDPRLAGATYVLYRLASRWGSRTLRRLSAELFHRCAPADSPLAALIDRKPVPPESRDELIRRHREVLETRPRAEKSLLALAVYTPEFAVDPGEGVATIKARLLSFHGLYRQALYYRSQDLFDAADSAAVLREIAELAELASASKPPPRPVVIEDSGSFNFAELVERARQQKKADLEKKLAREAQAGRGDPSDSYSASLEMVAMAGDVRLVNDPFDRLESQSIEIAALEPKTLSLDDATDLFSRGQSLLLEEKLEEAAGVFKELVDYGLLQREHFYSCICAEVRNLMWRVLDPQITSDHRFSLLTKLWDLAWELNLDTLLPLCERVLVAVLPQAGKAEVVAGLLERRPRSLQLRQVAASEALAAGDTAAWAEHLVIAAGVMTENRDLLMTAKLLMAARTAGETPALAEAQAAMHAMAEAVAEDGKAFSRLEAELSAVTEPHLILHRYEEFLEVHPRYEPAQLKLVARAQEAQLPLQATGVLMDLARHEVYREHFDEATRLFELVLQVEFENDEAMLFLATLTTRVTDLPQDIRQVRAALLEAHGLYQAAMHHALKRLDGSQRDDALRRQLIRLCERLGRDPSRHRVALGTLALERGELEQAKAHFDQAIEESENLERLLGLLMRVPQMDLVYTRLDLLRLRDPDMPPPNTITDPADPPPADPLSRVE